MKRGFRVVMALGGVLLGAATAQAQGLGRLRASLPFTFIVGSTTLPPGDYDLSFDEVDSPGVLTVRSHDGHQGVFVLTEATDAPGVADRGRLVFEKEGAVYVLTQVFAPGEHVGREMLGAHPAADRAD